MATPLPIAQGDLTTTPLAHVVMSVHARGLSGTLAIWPSEGSGQDRILFESGIVRRARVLQPSSDLIRSLLPLFERLDVPYAFYKEDLIGESGISGRADPWALVTASLRGGFRGDIVDSVLSAHEYTLLRVKSGLDLSRFEFIKSESVFIDMLRAGPIDVGTALRAAANEKVARRVLYMLTIADALETFEGELPGLSEPPPSGYVSTPPPRMSSPPPRISTPPPRMSSPPKPADGPIDSTRGRLSTPGDLSSPGRLSSPGSVSSPGSTRSPSRRPRRTSSQPPHLRTVPPTSEPPGTGPQKPPGLSPELTLKWNEVVGYANRIDEQNYFDMLEVSATAGVDQVREAYFTKAKKWHPDRLPKELVALKETADIIFGYLTEAERALTDENQRKNYIKAVQGGGGTPKSDRKLGRVLMAALEFQKVEVLIRRKDFDVAEDLVLGLIADVPDEPDYHAALASIKWKRDGVDAAEEALALLQTSLRLNPKHERSLMTKGAIFMRQNRVSDARPILREIVEMNPKNVEAERLLRLARMRGSQPPGKKKSGGFLSGFFGTKKK